MCKKMKIRSGRRYYVKKIKTSIIIVTFALRAHRIVKLLFLIGQLKIGWVQHQRNKE